MASCLKDLIKVKLIPEVPDSKAEGINVALTEELLRELERMLSLDKEDQSKPKDPVDLFEFYKRLILKLKDEQPDEFWSFMHKASNIEVASKARVDSLSKGWQRTADSSNIGP